MPQGSVRLAVVACLLCLFSTVSILPIKTDQGLRELHSQRIPVVAFDGEEFGWGGLSERSLERPFRKRK